MTKSEINDQLRQILDKEDLGSEGIVNRQRSSQHSDDTQVLLQHLSILVQYLKLDLSASKKELFDLKNSCKD